MSNHRDHTGVFTRFFRDEQPSDALTEEMILAVRTFLLEEINRRGIGSISLNNTKEFSGTFETAIDDLTSAFMLDRLLGNAEYIKSHVLDGRKVEGLVRTMVKQFIHRVQRHTDRVSTRIYDLIYKASAIWLNHGVTPPSETIGDVIPLNFSEALSPSRASPNLADALSMASGWEAIFVNAVKGGTWSSLIKELIHLFASLAETGMQEFSRNSLHEIAVSKAKSLISDDTVSGTTTVFDLESGDFGGIDRIVMPDSTYIDNESLNKGFNTLIERIRAMKRPSATCERRAKIVNFLMINYDGFLERFTHSEMAQELCIPRSTFSDDLRAIYPLMIEVGLISESPKSSSEQLPESGD